MKSRGLCKAHYQKWHRYGDPTISLRLRNCPAIDRFNFYASRNSEDGHWLWLGALNPKGYGSFWDGASVVHVHRWAYEHYVGPIPDGLVIDHLCRVRNCVNPDHMEPVTAVENTHRGDHSLMGTANHKEDCTCRGCSKCRRMASAPTPAPGPTG